MHNSGLDADIVSKVKALAAKFEATGQDLASYLDGLLHRDYLKYWDYIRLETLLDLQHPKTAFPDEVIFIGYHQITELYFKLILHELEQLCQQAAIGYSYWQEKLSRIERYFGLLVHSFDVMVDGMEPEQFLKFRMALLPASGFQSYQYRLIELYCTHLHLLVAPTKRSPEMAQATIEEQYQHIYWKSGATELASKRKTLTLLQFEEKYAELFIREAKKLNQSNVWHQYLQQAPHWPAAEKEKIDALMRTIDHAANVAWPHAHYRSAVRYLHKEPTDIAATGGTNWQRYLPPKNQQVHFFPNLWSAEEITNWGKQKNVNGALTV